jgi:hypothetical protein
LVNPWQAIVTRKKIENKKTIGLRSIKFINIAYSSGLVLKLPEFGHFAKQGQPAAGKDHAVGQLVLWARECVRELAGHPV